MQQQIESHIFNGLQRDLAVSKQLANYLYDAFNIRITARGEDTLLSITNERGPKQIEVDEEKKIRGCYLGSCMLNQYLVVFSTTRYEKQDLINTNRWDKIDEGELGTTFPIPKNAIVHARPEIQYPLEEQKDYITRIDLSKEDEVDIVTLYQGNLNFNINYLIEAIAYYENESIQKIYWTDGKNQPRYINIVKELLLEEYDPNKSYQENLKYNEGSFEFIPNLALNEKVTISKRDSTNGIFTPGVIQYAFTYYNKYGAESNIFYTSPLYYLTHIDRGASPEDTVHTVFDIHVDGIDTNFDYIRIYSIIRTSIDGESQVKRVADINISNIENIKESPTIDYTDTGTVGELIDKNLLLYIGGEEIVANTLEQKDNTLFLGNLKIKRTSIPSDLKKLLKQDRDKKLTDKNLSIGCYYSEVEHPYAPNNGGYYTNYFTLNQANIAGFKRGEKYRLGLQFQHKTGKWSEPCFLDDIEQVIWPKLEDKKTEDKSVTIYRRPSFRVGLIDKEGIDNPIKTEFAKLIEELEYIKVRPVVVFPQIQDRSIVCQGMLCPTIFNAYNRYNNNPFVQSSWYLRPFLNTQIISTSTDQHNTEVSKQVYCEFRHHYSIPDPISVNGEIYNSVYASQVPTSINALPQDIEVAQREFFIDQSILTFHSPEVQFSESFQDIEGIDVNLNIVGLINFTANASDIEVQTSTPGISQFSGFIKKLNNVKIDLEKLANDAGAAQHLLSNSCWYDTIVAYDTDEKTFGSNKFNKPASFALFPWHRKGSLNNDINRPADKGARSAVLKKKVISNLKFSSYTHYFSDTDFKSTDENNQEVSIPNTSYSISSVVCYDSDQVMMSKIKNYNSSNKLSQLTYYGNIDTLIISPSETVSDIVYGESNRQTLSNIIHDQPYGQNVFPELEKNSEPVRIKYKTTPHLVFSLNENKGSQVILPTINDLNKINNEQPIPFWKNKEELAEASDFAYLKVSDINKEDADIYGSKNIKAVFDAETGRIYNIIWVEIQEDPFDSRPQELSHFEFELKQKVDDIEDSITVKFVSDRRTTLYIYNWDNALQYYTNSREHTPPEYYQVLQDNYNLKSGILQYPYLFMGELKRKVVNNRFGGDTEEAIQHNMWLPAGEAVLLQGVVEGTNTIDFIYGDTYYQRFDCLKTYPFTNEDENQVVEIASFMCETRVNIDGRYDRNRGQQSNLNMSPLNFNLHNSVYSQQDNFFNYRILDNDFYKEHSYINQITWTKEKHPVEDVDQWTNLTLASVYDLDGSKGAITSLNTWKDQIYCFQEKGISNILFNSRVQIPTSDGVPIEITNSYKVDGYRYITEGLGVDNKWTIKESPSGIYFIDSISNNLYQIGEGITDVATSHNMSTWFKNSEIQKVLYDNVHHDVYTVTKDEALCYSEILGQFTSRMSYGGMGIIENYKDNTFSLRYHPSEGIRVYKMFEGEYDMYFTHCSDTTCHSNVKPWSLTFISNGLSNNQISQDKVFENIDYKMDVFEGDTYSIYNKDESFSSIRVENEYQDTGEVTLSNKKNRSSNLKNKFRTWRVNIPRNIKLDDRGRGSRDRIRNPWCKVTLTKNPTLKKCILHDLNMYYYI